MSKGLLPSAVFIAAACIATVPGCARNPTLGEQLVSHGEEDVDLGKQWTEGQDLINEGNRDIEKGTRLLNEGREKLKRGKQLVEGVERVRSNSPSRS